MPKAGQPIRTSDLEITVYVYRCEYDFHGGFGNTAPFNSDFYLLSVDTDHYACHETIILLGFAVIIVKKT